MEKSKKKQLTVSIIAIVLLIVATVGVTYAFFNYTRTGTANTVSVGRIAFNSSQDGRINLTNIFPIDPTETGIMNDATKVGTVAITVTGDTSYDKGIEYLVSATNVTNTVGTKTIPISISATASGTLGTSDDDYFNNRDTSTNHIYKVLASDTISEGDQLMVGYIARNATGINGTITIKAYIDKDNIAISDTYDGTASNNMGTTNDWVNGRTVFTTTEWNSLQGTGVSFQVKVEANEGIWVTAPVASGIIESCPDCKFIYSTNTMYTTWNTSNQTPTVLTSGLLDSYIDVVESSSKNYFLGVKLNSNNEVTNAYSCGIKDDVPFCIEGYSGEMRYTSNKTLLNGTSLWNGACTSRNIDTHTSFNCGSWNNNSISATTDSLGVAYVGIDYSKACYVYPYGQFNCFE